MKKINKFAIFSIASLLCNINLWAQEAMPVVEKVTNIFDLEIIDIFLIFVALVLLIPIYYLSKIFNWSLKHYLQSKLNNSGKLFVLFGLILPAILSAQTQSSPFDSFNFLRWFLLFFIFIEGLVLASFTYQIFAQFRSYEKEEEEPIQKENFIKRWWSQANNFVEIEEEHKLDIGHVYDGIQELDNKIPAWFSASFFLSILFGVVYVWQYHIAEISPLQEEEYELEVQKAAVEHQQYLKMSGSRIDENTLEFSLEKDDIDEGEKVYIANCATCHVADGGGAAGPNLTDNQWLFGCSPTDVFQSIKYGRKNGMMAWKDNFSDKQIVQIASFVHSLEGKKPASPKQPQGEVCSQEVVQENSTISIDSLAK